MKAIFIIAANPTQGAILLEIQIQILRCSVVRAIVELRTYSQAGLLPPLVTRAKDF